ncbi:hypothetical protein HYG77_37645 (plasmid) [Rhodococcus sp. ZPP]|nr:MULTISPECIES: hypothetical protein [Rhodococcus]QHE73673.1 hypothetical protein GFS60_07336 [Rhodococcus sp. WAY2]QTJ71168.1 hypothetical protein HYG77_37645 [Rhodococcus sp. ZPP]
MRNVESTTQRQIADKTAGNAAAAPQAENADAIDRAGRGMSRYLHGE